MSFHNSLLLKMYFIATSPTFLYIITPLSKNELCYGRAALRSEAKKNQ